MIKYWKYYAVTRTGHEICGSMQGERSEVLGKLTSANMYLINLVFDVRALLSPSRRQLSPGVLMLFFEDMRNMHAAGMNVEPILRSMKETTRDNRFIITLDVMEQGVREGKSLTEVITETGIFPWIVYSTLHAGERSGKLQEALGVLSCYFKKSHYLDNKIKDSLVYPCIIFILLITIMFFIGIRVIPQLQRLLPADAMRYGATSWVLNMSAIMSHHWLLMVALCAVLIVTFFLWHQKRKDKFESFIYQIPVLGEILKEISLSFYFLNLSVLLKSGVSLLQSINDLNAMHSSRVSRHFLNSRDFILGGMSFWESLKSDAFFPTVVAYTIRRGEEMARLDEYCFKLSEYFDKRIASKMDVLIQFIQPILLGFGGLFLAVIAFAFLVPIYGSLTKIAGG